MDGFLSHERLVCELAPGDRVAYHGGSYRTVLDVRPADDETGHMIVRSSISAAPGMPPILAPAARYLPTAHVHVLELAARQGVPA